MSSSSSFSPAAVASVSGLVIFGTTTSLLAKIGEFYADFKQGTERSRKRGIRVELVK